MSKQEQLKNYIATDVIRGTHVSFSCLKYFANNRASSLINVSSVCLLPTFILEISMVVSKKPSKQFMRFLVLVSIKYSLLPFFVLDCTRAHNQVFTQTLKAVREVS